MRGGHGRRTLGALARRPEGELALEPVVLHRHAVGVLPGDGLRCVREGGLHRGGRLPTRHRPANHVLDEVGTAELGVLVGEVVGSGRGGEDAAGFEDLGEAAAVAGGDGDPRPAGGERTKALGDLDVVERLAIGTNDGLARRRQLAHVAGVEEHDVGVRACVGHQPVQSAPDGVRARRAIGDEQALLWGDAVAGERLVDLEGVGDGRPQIV